MSDMTLKIPREVTKQEIEDMLTGTGVTTWPWWGYIDKVSGGDDWIIRHWDKDEEEGVWKRSILTDKQILAGVQVALDLGMIPEESAREASDELGLFDAVAADICLQYAIYREIVWG